MLPLPVLRVGVTGPEVGNWQRFLNEQRILDWQAKPLVVDESFGQRTEFATKAWQSLQNQKPDGELANYLRPLAYAQGFLPFVQAKGFNVADRGACDVIVIHTMEYPETDVTAAWCAQFFTNPQRPKIDKSGKPMLDGNGKPILENVAASAHYVIDQGAIIQCVRERDIAWGAPGTNNNGLHIEHAGFANQTSLQWADSYSRKLLTRSAYLVAKLCLRHGIPVTRLLAQDLKAKARGICGHDAVSDAFGGTHHDPGRYFPWASYIQEVEAQWALLTNASTIDPAT